MWVVQEPTCARLPPPATAETRVRYGLEHGRWTKYRAGRTFGYLWPRTVTVGLKQTLAEQAALVAERPEVFEKQFTAHGFGWVVVQLAGIERDKLAELVFEAWRLSAPAELVAERADRLAPLNGSCSKTLSAR